MAFFLNFRILMAAIISPNMIASANVTRGQSVWASQLTLALTAFLGIFHAVTVDQRVFAMEQC